jgi:hypothetical protein
MDRDSFFILSPNAIKKSTFIKRQAFSSANEFSALVWPERSAKSWQQWGEQGSRHGTGNQLVYGYRPPLSAGTACV